MKYTLNPFTHRFDAIDTVVVPPGTVASLTGDLGGAIGPDGSGNINIVGANGIETYGDPLTNTITVAVDFYLTGSGQTIGAVTTNLISLDLGAVPNVYQFNVNIAGYDTTSNKGIGANEVAVIRTTGAAALVINTVDSENNLELPIVAPAAFSTVSGNNFLVNAIGTAGETIKWRATVTYVQVV